jgi:hypothetical protein
MPDCFAHGVPWALSGGGVTVIGVMLNMAALRNERCNLLRFQITAAANARIPPALNRKNAGERSKPVAAGGPVTV